MHKMDQIFLEYKKRPNMRSKGELLGIYSNCNVNDLILHMISYDKLYLENIIKELKTKNNIFFFIKIVELHLLILKNNGVFSKYYGKEYSSYIPKLEMYDETKYMKNIYIINRINNKDINEDMLICIKEGELINEEEVTKIRENACLDNIYNVRIEFNKFYEN